MVDISYTHCQHLYLDWGRLCHPFEPHLWKMLPLQWDWDTGAHDMAVSMSNNAHLLRTSLTPYMKPLCNCSNSFSPSKTFVYPEALLHSFRTWVNGPLPLCFISFVLQIPLKLAMKDFRGQTPVTPASEYKQRHFLSQCACSSAFWEVIRSQVVSYRDTLTGMMVCLSLWPQTDF